MVNNKMVRNDSLYIGINLQREFLDENLHARNLPSLTTLENVTNSYKIKS